MGRRLKNKLFDDTEIVEQKDEASSGPATAQQVHRIVTTYKKDVPLDEAEALTVEDEIEEDAETEEEAPLDPIEEMFSELNVGEHRHSWTMTVERLPHYDKDGRHDAHAKRVSCGTRPVTLDWIEDIRREFARPYKPNHFRITFRRDGKFYSHWPDALLLEPPPYEEIAQYEAKAAAAAPPLPSAITINNPGQPQTFKQMLDQMKQLADLRTVLFPELAHLTQQLTSPSGPAQGQPLTTESALLHLVSADESLMEKAVSGLSRLFRRTEDGTREIGFLDLAFEAIKQNTLPQLVREFRAMMREGAQLNGQPQIPAPALPQGAGPDHQVNQLWAGAQTQVQPQGAPGGGQEASAGIPADNYRSDTIPLPNQLLNYAVTACAHNALIEVTADWIISFEKIYPSVTPYIQMFLGAAPDQALQWLAQNAPETQPIAAAPHAQGWVESLQKALFEEEETDGPDGSVERVAGNS